jgi:hypothetical protein
MLINFLIFLYAVGFFGSFVACASLIYRFQPQNRRCIPVLIIFGLIPGLSHYLMWEAFQDYEYYRTLSERIRKSFEEKMSQVNHGRGVKWQKV